MLSASDVWSIARLCTTRLLDALENAATVWKDVNRQVPNTQQSLVPLTKLWSQKTEEEMETYQEIVTEQVLRLSIHLAPQHMVCLDCR